MLIYCEDTLLYGAEFFSDWGEVRFFSGNKVTSDQLKDAELLFVRSTTKVNEGLLQKAVNLKFVATATSGSEHLDGLYLRDRGIPYYSAGGCNAIAVAEYVISAIFNSCEKLAKPLSQLTVAIVGCGHVGTVLATKLKAIGMDIRLYDPPLEADGDSRTFVNFDDVMSADIISLHVPLVTEGDYPTQKMFGHEQLKQLTSTQLLINACRGEVVCNEALLKLCDSDSKPIVVLDVFENEPTINFELAQRVDYATAHIAGHTIEGKARGTEMVYLRAGELFDLPTPHRIESFLPSSGLAPVEINSHQSLHNIMRQLVLGVYDIGHDSREFKANVKDADAFRYSRKNYAIRREFGAQQVNTGNVAHSKAIYELGFSAYY